MNPAKKSTAFLSLFGIHPRGFRADRMAMLVRSRDFRETLELVTSAQKAASAEFEGLGSGEADARRFQPRKERSK
jgi:hypothetical protein